MPTLKNTGVLVYLIDHSVKEDYLIFPYSELGLLLLEYLFL